MATKTAVIILQREAIKIFAIPPLSPQPPNFFDHNHTHILPLFTIPLPDDIDLYDTIRWNTISNWYFGSSQPLYCDILCYGSILHRFQIILKPDLSTASLQVINTSEFTLHDFNRVIFPKYMICEDAVTCCYIDDRLCETGIYMGLTTACFANDISHGGPVVDILLPEIWRTFDLFLSPASGRFVGVDTDNTVAVLDFF